MSKLGIVVWQGSNEATWEAALGLSISIISDSLPNLTLAIREYFLYSTTLLNAIQLKSHGTAVLKCFFLPVAVGLLRLYREVIITSAWTRRPQSLTT
jgi:hypothetical protein